MQPERRLQRRHDVSSTTTTLSAAAAVGATNVKVASVAGLVAGNTITIDSTGANPETVTMTIVGTQGSTGTGVTFTPALAFAHASGATVVKNGVAGTQNLELRLARQRPPLHDRRAARAGPDELVDALPRLQQPVAVDEPRSELDADRGARPAHGPSPADDSASNNPLYAGQYATISTIAPSKSDPNTIYVGTDNGRLWRTTDLGVTWQQFANPFAPNPARWVTSVVVDPVDAQHAYASYGGFREGYTSANVFETTKAGSGGGSGTTWKNVSGNLPNAPVNMIAYDQANDTLYAATDLGVYFMQNDTKVWTKLGDNLPNTATEDLKIQARAASSTSARSAAARGGSRSCPAPRPNRLRRGGRSRPPRR